MSDSKEYIFKLPLVQSTPLLHFDNDPEATLRATELKPKIDHYILANCKVLKSWLIPLPEGEKSNSRRPALKYKLSIVAENNRQLRDNSYPMFFGRGKVGVKAEDVSLHFFCLDSSLLDCLKSLDWSEFFLANNFGTRQDKGYGSFFPKYKDMGHMRNDCGKYIKVGGDAGRYRLDSFFTVAGDNQNKPDWRQVMKRVEAVYKCLRGGINGPKDNDFYFKSLMFSYAKERGLFWDKRIIKNHFYDSELKKQKNEEYDFRDYLGLSTIEKWGTLGMVRKSAGSVKRWKSPILFKLLFNKGNNTWYVYLLHREIPQKGLKGTKVTVRATEGISPLPLTLYPDFSMHDYFNFVFKKGDGKINYSSQCNNAERARNVIGDLNTLRDNYKAMEDDGNE